MQRSKKDPKEKTKKLSEYKHVQMMLPFVFPEKELDYSRSIELYDAVPKYFWGKANRIEDQFLEVLERKFEFRGRGYNVTIAPARIKDKDGVYREYYPGKREELIEDALRKLACDGQGVYLDDQAGVIFTLYQLQKELKRMGHTYSKQEIKNAILLCRRAGIELESGDGDTILSSPIFETVGLNTKEDWQGIGKQTKCFVRFNLLVTRSIKANSFRQLNYKQCMGYKRILARWLHKRMSHVYLQAAWNNTYDIMLSTIIRDSGMKQYKDHRNNLRKVREALSEMREKGVISKFKEEKILEQGKGKILDVKFIISPGISFIRDMKKANAAARQHRLSTQK